MFILMLIASVIAALLFLVEWLGGWDWGLRR